MWRNLQFRAIWSHLLRKSLMENFIVCSVKDFYEIFWIWFSYFDFKMQNFDRSRKKIWSKNLSKINKQMKVGYTLRWLFYNPWLCFHDSHLKKNSCCAAISWLQMFFIQQHKTPRIDNVIWKIFLLQFFCNFDQFYNGFIHLGTSNELLIIFT